MQKHQGDVIQVVVHPLLRKPFEDWLQERQLEMGLLPNLEDDLPTYVITPKK